ncbi:MAG: UPF0280 family protein [Candidatus Omnitrophica bacterium]|nr:UPF0280 family protein [Candidatus Omnitrophota bacterium]
MLAGDDRSIYRDWVKSDDLVKTRVTYKETDLYIMADRELKEDALKAVKKYRGKIERYIASRPEFKDSLRPIGVEKDAPLIIRRMAKAGKLAGVGPMAAVAGAVAEFVGNDLLKSSKNVIVENGGDIFIKSLKKRRFGVFAGDSPLTGKLTFEIIADNTPLGVCTSSGTVGPSLSYGKADAACIISKDTALADAVATETGNKVKSAQDIEKAIDFARSIPGITGAIVIVGERFASWGNIKLGE